MINKIIYSMLIMLFLSLINVSYGEEEFPEKILEKTSDSITLIDQAGRTVTVNLPVTRLIVTNYREMEPLLAMGAGDLMVGVDSSFHTAQPYFGLKDVPEVSKHGTEVNLEKVLQQSPDLVIMPITQGTSKVEDVSKNLNNVSVIAFSLSQINGDRLVRDLEILGAIVGKEKKAEELMDWVQKYDDIVADRIGDIKSEDMPTYYYEYSTDMKKWYIMGPAASQSKAARGCGAIDIADDLGLNSTTTSREVGAEWVLSKNPEYIIFDSHGSTLAGIKHTPEGIQANTTQKIKERATEGFENIAAIKNNNLYVLQKDWTQGIRWSIGHLCIAKWFHPELFADLDPDTIHKEYLEKFFPGVELKGTWGYHYQNNMTKT
jgi:iron complex transport system substrate-binding protein